MIVMFAAAASAHIAPDPPAVQSGLATTVTFNVEHGCGDSPTSSLQFKIPAGVTDAKAIPPAGWNGTQDATSVTFSGGSLDPHTPGDFEISFTASTAVGSISWLIVQKCAVGEIDWFDPIVTGQPEPANPAPTIKITTGPPTSDDLAVAPDDDSDAAATTITGAHTATSATAPSAAATSAATVTTPGALTSTPAANRDKTTDNGNTALIILIVVLVVIVAGGAYVVTRKSKTPPSVP